MASRGDAENTQEQMGHPKVVEPDKVLDLSHEVRSELAELQFTIYKRHVGLALDARQSKIRRTIGTVRASSFVLLGAAIGFAINNIVEKVPSGLVAVLVATALAAIGAILGTFLGSFRIKHEKDELVRLGDELEPRSNQKDEA